ncbi:hypothetical protein EBB07_02655 [Paenibacillaceae bacterium]|nr:hypothetical protein EBB07_02655 [Paenibacillaceae bacterium]
MKVDAHQHFWNLEKNSYPWLVPSFGPIYRTFEAPELAPLLQEAGIDKTIIVQAMDSYEDTDYMLETAAAYDWVGGVVGWVPLNRPQEAERMLDHYIQNPLFKGIRHLIHEESDPDWVVQPSVIEGLRLLEERGLSFDVVAVFPNHLKHVPTLAEQLPNLRMVIDHLAKPPIKTQQLEPWASELAHAASYPNVYAKLSGLNTAASEQWSAVELQPCIDIALQSFGASRLMFGSDWPVALLNGDYAAVWQETGKALAACSDAEREAIQGKTAAAFYRIES